MAELFRYWTHGTNIIPEYTKEHTKTQNGLYMRRAGWGTQVKQHGNTFNWFHFPLTSASALDGDPATINRVYLKADINNHAVITDIHVTMIDQSSATPGAVPFLKKKVNLTGTSNVFSFPFPNYLLGGALVLSVKVKFESPKGEVIFKAAGSNLFEK